MDLHVFPLARQTASARDHLKHLLSEPQRMPNRFEILGEIYLAPGSWAVWIQSGRSLASKAR